MSCSIACPISSRENAAFEDRKRKSAGRAAPPDQARRSGHIANSAIGANSTHCGAVSGSPSRVQP
jgi:hypothetical protein